MDRMLTVSWASSCKSKEWVNTTLTWSELVTRLEKPRIVDITFDEYSALPKDQKAIIKDGLCVVGGAIANGLRTKLNTSGNDVITLDADKIPQDKLGDIIEAVNKIQCAYVLHSTLSSSESQPKIHIFIPLSRSVNADEYDAVIRKLAEIIGMTYFDPTCFKVNQPMFTPTYTSDTKKFFMVGLGVHLDPASVLAMYEDWTDPKQRPVMPREKDARRKKAARQADPMAKSGIVGAFCKTYSVIEGIEKFLPHIYKPCDVGKGRYTYISGSAEGGAYLWDNDNFLCSHHGTDPASGSMRNIFDLVRLHLCDGESDEEEDSPMNKTVSWDKMVAFANAIPEVKMLCDLERLESKGLVFDSEEVKAKFATFLGGVKRNRESGKVIKTIANYRYAFECDPRLEDGYYLDEFAQYWYLPKRPPWDKNSGEYLPRQWKDFDDSGVVDMLETTHGFPEHKSVKHALILAFHHKGVHPVRDYLKQVGVIWDGKERVDKVFIDYLGCEDNNYTRRVTRLWFVGAVARIMQPGVKFDNMPILSGDQGRGKSELIKRLGKCKWNSEGFDTFEGKEASINLQGRWLIEIGEMQAFKGSTIETIKNFLSLCEDYFRVPFERHARPFPRSCVFMGTTNHHDYLTDRTGNRRFYPLDTGINPCVKSMFSTPETDAALEYDIDQIWAEAYLMYKSGEKTYIPPNELEEFIVEQEAHMACDARVGWIEAYLNKPILTNWYKRPEDERVNFAVAVNTVDTEPRTKICALEIWRYCFRQKDLISQKETREINAIIGKIEGWEKQKWQHEVGELGKQVVFTRKTDTLDIGEILGLELFGLKKA